MGLLQYLKERYIHISVAVLLILLILVLHVFQSGAIDAESARVYLQALTAVATLALLYYAYINIISKKEGEIAHLELAVRPVLVWEVEAEGDKVTFVHMATEHPIYDFRAVFHMAGKEMRLDERHLDVAGQGTQAKGSLKKEDISQFIARAFAGNSKPKLLSMRFSYHSEVGGRYEFVFTKEVARGKSGFAVKHRKIVSAKYPWRKEEVSFVD